MVPYLGSLFKYKKKYPQIFNMDDNNCCMFRSHNTCLFQLKITLSRTGVELGIIKHIDDDSLQRGVI